MGGRCRRRWHRPYYCVSYQTPPNGVKRCDTDLPRLAQIPTLALTFLVSNGFTAVLIPTSVNKRDSPLKSTNIDDADLLIDRANAARGHPH